VSHLTWIYAFWGTIASSSGDHMLLHNTI